MNYLEWKNRQERIIKEYSREPRTRRLKYRCWAAIIVCMLLLLTSMALMIWMEDISWRVIYTLRGCAGAAAIVFVVLYAIYIYRVQSAAIRDRR